ncbi:hypothetical protein SEUCBS139899_006211 [Sporothrix eucalyptigena]|uniref:AA1-like domain-containing protein n=1 Tax=Sporothrix eucalyptigena TaxID=1812306 RepID=A0ABP0AS91_9PEZI
MHLLAHLPFLSLFATATTGLQLLQYDIPDELLALFGAGNPDPVSSSASAVSASTSFVPSGTAYASSSSTTSSSDSCYYPATFTLNNFTTWSPATNTSLSYVSFKYVDSGTKITTPCAYNATSKSLTAGTGLADRYACDDSTISFIWLKGKLTAIETTCPGQTATKFEASGSLIPTGLKCAQTNGTDDVGLGQGQGTLCFSSRPFSANFTSQEPSPLQN